MSSRSLGRGARTDSTSASTGRAILETNGRRWHDDPLDYESDDEKFSVPIRHGYRILFATWAKVTRHPDELLTELAATLSAPT